MYGFFIFLSDSTCWPIRFNGKGTIKEIDIISSITGTITCRLPSELRLAVDDEQDINEIMNILNKYKYLKILKFYNPRVVPANPTDGVINLFIHFLQNNL